MRLTKPGQYRDDTYLDGYSDTIHSVMQLRYAKKDGYNPIWSRDGVTFCRKDNGQGCLAINDIPFSFEEIVNLKSSIAVYKDWQAKQNSKLRREMSKAAEEDREAYYKVIKMAEDKLDALRLLEWRLEIMQGLI